MAEERVILQVKFDQIRATGVGTAATARRAPGISDTASRANGSTNGANGSSRESIDDLLKRLNKAGSDISDLQGYYSQRRESDNASRASTTAGVGAAARVATGSTLPAFATAFIAGAIGATVALIAAKIVKEASLQSLIERFRRVNEELRKMAENAQYWSRVVAAQATIADRRRLLAERRQARTLEDDLARLVRTRGAADEAIIGLKTAIAQTMLPRLIPFLEAATGAIVVIEKTASKIAELSSHPMFATDDTWLEKKLRPIWGDIVDGIRIGDLGNIWSLANRALTNYLRSQGTQGPLASMEAEFDKLSDAAFFEPPSPQATRIQ